MNIRWFVSVGRLGLSGVFALTALGPALSQDDGVISLQDIVIVGEKEGRTVAETVSSVGVVTGTDIENSTIIDINDAFERIANVSQRFGGEGITIRGISNGSVTAGGTFVDSPVITTYVDGAPLSPFALRVGPQSVWDVEQVEVLRGSQSTKQGRNSLAGAVVIKSKDPVYATDGAFRFGYGTQNSVVGSGVLNGVIVDDLIAVRAAVDYIATDGFNDNATLGLDDQAEVSELTLRGKVRFDPKILAGMTNVLTVSYSKNESGDDSLDATNPEARLTFGNVQGEEDLDQSIFALESILNISDTWSLKNFVNYNRARYNRLDDDNPSLAASQWSFTGFPGINAGLNEIGNDELRQRTNLTETFTEEIRLHHDGKRLKGHAGFYFADIQEEDQRSFVGGFDSNAVGVPLVANIAPPGDPPIIVPVIPNIYPFRLAVSSPTDFSIQERNWALFGELSYDLTDLITVFGGLRYDTVRKSTRFLTDTSVTNLPVAAGPAAPLITFINGQINANPAIRTTQGTTESEDSAYLPTGGITLNFSDDISLSAFAKRGYRAGGSALSNLLGIPFTFDPEFTWDYEIALRSSFANNRITANANIFYTDWKDQQVAILTDVGGFTDLTVTNAASSELYGLELEIQAQVTEAFKAFTTVGYLQTEFLDFPTTDPTINFAGNEFPFAPEWNIAAGGQYQFRNGIFVQADANYTSAVFTEAENDPETKLDARTIFNGRIGFNGDDFSVYAFATNIFDEVYLTSNVRGTNLGNPSRNLIKVGDGRTIGFRVTAKLK